MKLFSLIPARGGSKRLPGKNIMELAGKPMIAHVIEAVKKSEVADKVVVSSDSDEIIEVAKRFGASTDKRPAALAADTTRTADVVRYVIDKPEFREYEYVMVNQPTSPLLTAERIKAAFTKMTENNYDCLFSVKKVQVHPKYYWQITNDGKLRRFLAQGEYPDETLYQPNGAVYIYKTDFFRNSKLIYPYSESNTGYLEMSALESIDVDTADDFNLVKLILKR